MKRSSGSPVKVCEAFSCSGLEILSWRYLLAIRAGIIGSTWRFMGSFKWGYYKSPNMGYNDGYPTYNSVIYP